MAQNRDKLIKITADKLDLDYKVVLEAVKLQDQMLKVTMQTDPGRTFYRRKVGFFQHSNIRKKLMLEKLERAKNKSNNEDEEDPLEFN